MTGGKPGVTFTLSRTFRACFTYSGMPEPQLRWHNGKYWIKGQSRPMSDADCRKMCNEHEDAVSKFYAEEIRKDCVRFERGLLDRREWYVRMGTHLNMWRTVQALVTTGGLAGHSQRTSELEAALSEFMNADFLYFQGLFRAMDDGIVNLDMISGGLVGRVRILMTIDAAEASPWHAKVKAGESLAEFVEYREN